MSFSCTGARGTGAAFIPNNVAGARWVDEKNRSWPKATKRRSDGATKGEGGIVDLRFLRGSGQVSIVEWKSPGRRGAEQAVVQAASGGVHGDG